MKGWQATAIVLLLNLVLFALIANLLLDAPRQAQPWSYRFEQIRQENLQSKLDNLGAQGWELVVAERIRGAHSFDVVLKRPR